MIATDMHVHSCFSSDSKENPESIIETAIKKGFSYVYFTDHHDTDFPVSKEDPDMNFQLDFPAYIECLTKLREQYSQKIQLRIGVEQGICPEVADKVTTIANQYDFDFIIGSSHLTSLINGDPYYPEYYEGMHYIDAYRKYFMSEVENVRLTSAFDVYGHLDYAIRYCPDKSFRYRFHDYQDIFEELFKLLIEKGKGIEINTAGIRKIGFAHPHMDALRLYREMGGEIITIGSDAHTKEDIGFGFDVAEEMLKSCCFRYYTVFNGRQPEFITL